VKIESNQFRISSIWHYDFWDPNRSTY
jgi:hypothetical protein